MTYSEVPGVGSYALLLGEHDSPDNIYVRQNLPIIKYNPLTLSKENTVCKYCQTHVMEYFHHFLQVSEHSIQH